jgi:hypothetical protein
MDLQNGLGVKIGHIGISPEDIKSKRNHIVVDIRTLSQRQTRKKRQIEY